MSENSPRWPSASGAGGLDFSRNRPSPSEQTEANGRPAEWQPLETPPAPDRAGHAVPGVDGAGASVTTPSRTADDPDATDEERPDADATGESGSEQTRTLPAFAGRAARAAQEWAAKARSAVVITPGGPSAGSAATTGAASGAAAGVVTGAAVADHHEPTPAEGAAPHRTVRRTRKARLRLARIDPWSVMKTSFLFSIAFGVMLVAATFMVWSVLAGSGALESTNQLINTLIGDEDTAFNIGDFLSMSRVLGFATVVAAVDVVILTAVATLFAFLYNLAATVMGGLEVTLAED